MTYETYLGAVLEHEVKRLGVVEGGEHVHNVLMREARMDLNLPIHLSEVELGETGPEGTRRGDRTKKILGGL